MADVEVVSGHPPLNGTEVTSATTPPEPEEEGPLLSISINNVVCSFSTKCHLNLKKIATEGTNVEYHRQHGVIILSSSMVC